MLGDPLDNSVFQNNGKDIVRTVALRWKKSASTTHTFQAGILIKPDFKYLNSRDSQNDKSDPYG